jgi:hypothetical protein
MIFLMKEKYIMKNARRRKKSRKYAEVILRAAKFAELTFEINQIFLIYNEIDVKFQRNISMSKVDIKLNNFLIELNDKKNVWWQLAERKRENSYEFSINIQNQNFYEYFRYATYQFEYQRFRNDRDESSRYLQYIESQRYDQTYDDARKYQSQKYQSRDYFNQSNNSSKSIFISTSYFNSISQNDINRNQRSLLNTNQFSNVNEYSSRSDSIRNTSLKNDSQADQIRSNRTSRFTQFSSRSNEFDRRNDEYKNKIYNAKMNESNLKQKYSHKDEYEKNYSQKNRDQELNVSVNFAEYDDQENELYYEKITINFEEKYESFAKFVEIETSCITCKKVFSFKNKLHKHLKNCKSTRIEKIKKTTSSSQKKSKKLIIMKFTTFTSNKSYDLTFLKWNYAKVLIKLRSEFTEEDYVFLNTDIEASLTNKNFVLKRLSKTHIHLITTFLIVREIKANVHEIKKYVNFSIYLSSKNDFIKLIEIHRELHLIESLKANMLINNDILELEDIIINVQKKNVIIRSCENLTIEMKIHQRESFMQRNVINQFATVISSESYVKISYKMKNLLIDRDFLFESCSKISVFIYAHVIDARTTKVIVRNESTKSMKISRNFRLRVAQKIQYDDCFYASQKHQLTLQTFKKNSIIKDLKPDLILDEVVDLTLEKNVERSRSSSKNSKIRIIADEVKKKSKEKISFDVTIFDDEREKQKFDTLINEFSKIWKNEEFIDVFEKQWMRLSLKKKWQDKLIVKIKIYSLNTNDRKIVNDIFNRLQTQNKLKFTIVATSFAYSIFVVWTVKNEVRKERVIINIRELNNLLVSDVYSISSQSEIIDDLLECKYLSILDANVFFYQWRVHSNDAYKQTMMTHREQKIFLILIMRNRNFVTYVQRQMNILLNNLRKFVKIYIDDIICRSKTFQKHLNHLRILFRVFLRKKIIINSLKTFLEYQSVILLERRVNVLELITAKKKLKAIALLKFSKNLTTLERYLNLTEYLRDKMYFFAKVSKFLQELKTKLLKDAFKNNTKRRKDFTNRSKIISINKKMTSFLFLQENLIKITRLFHFDKEK